jgi:glycosyltransferase involved in cell wall biosynthesis
VTIARARLGRLDARALSREAAAKESGETVLLAGALPDIAAGNAVSSQVLLDALRPSWHVDLLTHEASPFPRFRAEPWQGHVRVRLGTQPFCVHGEALLAGRLFRPRLARWPCAWVVNSRYAGALLAAGVPYALWEATTIEDELRATDIAAIRRAGIGSGVGTVLHRALLPAGRRLEGLLYRGAHALYAMSEYTRARMISTHGVPADRVRVLEHPPSVAFLDALATQAAAHPPRAGHADGVPRLLFVGRADDPRKHFALLLEAIRALRTGGTPAVLTVVGPHREQWRRALGEAADPREVTFTGRIDPLALASAYLTHDLLVLPSRQEGFGIVVAEALHAGLPVVSTRSGGPEATLRDSRAGVLVDHRADALASAMQALLGAPDRRAEMSRAAIAYARTTLSFDRFRERVAGVTATLRDAALRLRRRR